MSATFYDAQGGVLSHNYLQDKSRWCANGESMEQAFVKTYGTSLGYMMNPAKNNNPFVPDLISLNGKLTDLKSQHSPFFMAQKKFGMDPTYAVVFNLKDRYRYEQYYPDIDILYFIDWLAVKADIYGIFYEVTPHRGIYRVPFKAFTTLLDRSRLHAYQQRINDTSGNAKESYVVDIRDAVFTRLL